MLSSIKNFPFALLLFYLLGWGLINWLPNSTVGEVASEPSLTVETIE